jgi:hypothetical protein
VVSIPRGFEAIAIADYTDLFALKGGLSFEDLSFNQFGKDTQILDSDNQLLVTVTNSAVDVINNPDLYI